MEYPSRRDLLRLSRREQVFIVLSCFTDAYNCQQYGNIAGMAEHMAVARRRARLFGFTSGTIARIENLAQELVFSIASFFKARY